MSIFTVDKSIDCKGLSCPMPIVRTKKAIEEITPGQVLEVTATDPGSVADIRSWADRTGHQYLGTIQEDGAFKHYVRKSDPKEEKPEQKYPHVITNDELRQQLSSNPIVIDVREPAEYAFGHIPGAKSIPFGKLEERIEELRGYADREIYVVCRTGNRSDTACQILNEKGFAKVKNVVPGMSQWDGPVSKI
ncbi:sulfurtransferase TusA family protein [Effusibacillus lacus]|uniref:Rhodanese domain-containing protein n=1 Tax=Effusibacillus lacus TaxID=1348429 RepID=A0A292YKY8_9BACL|nr:sulfurtransferase TusA family protein [Effusibacillus lacus]TCS71208.1 rhodanese-related sulfurtransferase [Effusibacillus lacus]GAX89836.1 hypothetical protein EFBL_1461 [Effusibacillus lacus]